jgi:hypothetical protein
MSTEASMKALSKYLMGSALVLVLVGLLVAIVACKELSADTSAPVSVDASAQTATTAAANTILASTTEVGTTPEPKAAPDHPEALPVGTTESPREIPPMEVVPLEPGFQLGPLWTRYEEDDPSLNWVGTWGPRSHIPEASGGYLRMAPLWPGETTPEHAFVTFRFEGTRVRLIAESSPYGLYGKVTLDGHEEYWVDYFTPDRPESGHLGIYYQKIVWTSPVLASGIHEVMLERTESVNPACWEEIWSTSVMYINFDAVDVMGTLVRPFD